MMQTHLNFNDILVLLFENGIPSWNVAITDTFQESIFWFVLNECISKCTQTNTTMTQCTQVQAHTPSMSYTVLFAHSERSGWVLPCSFNVPPQENHKIPPHHYSCLAENLLSQTTKLPSQSVCWWEKINSLLAQLLMNSTLERYRMLMMRKQNTLHCILKQNITCNRTKAYCWNGCTLSSLYALLYCVYAIFVWYVIIPNPNNI